MEKTGISYFGEYPQSLKDDSVEIVSKTPDKLGYYLGSDGNKYASVIAYQYTQYAENDPKQYFSNVKPIVPLTEYYFKVEPIKWILINDDKKYYCISDMILDNEPFDLNGKGVSYTYSTLRKWLNNDFYKQAFDKKTRELLIGDEESIAVAGDKISILSDKICLNFVEPLYGLYREVTDYARAKGVRVGRTLITMDFGPYWILDYAHQVTPTRNGRYIDVDASISSRAIDSLGIGVVPVVTCFKRIDEVLFAEKESSALRYFETMNPDAIKPVRSTSSSAGYDFFLPQDFEAPVVIEPGKTAFFKLGVRAKMPSDEVLLLFPRSSIGIKRGLVLSNTVGVIDADYYGNPDNGGEICLSLRNVSDQAQTVSPGEKILQGIFIKYSVTTDDTITTKRMGGIGSTGN